MKISNTYVRDDLKKALHCSTDKIFDYFWDMPRDWIEHINHRHGGWGGVSKHCIELGSLGSTVFYLKRQENQTKRSLISPIFSRPTYWYEYNTLSRLNSEQSFGPDLLYYAERKQGSNLQAILATKEIDHAISLDEMLKSSDANDPEMGQALINIGKKIKSLHDEGLVHGSLYSKHIFVNPENGHCWLIDFEKTQGKGFTKKAFEKDIDRLFRRTPQLTQKYRDLIMAGYQTQPKLQLTK